MVDSNLYLRRYAYLDETHWRGGFDDSLVQRRECKWTRLMVDKAAVRRLWWFGSQEPPQSPTSGFAGRPSKSRHLIEDELRRRAAAHQLAPTLKEQSRALLQWLTGTHPSAPRPTEGVTGNNIRHEYRQLKGTKLSFRANFVRDFSCTSPLSNHLRQPLETPANRQEMTVDCTHGPLPSPRRRRRLCPPDLGPSMLVQMARQVGGGRRWPGVPHGRTPPRVHLPRPRCLGAQPAWLAASLHLGRSVGEAWPTVATTQGGRSRTSATR
jgi:hypothetical protein